MNISCPHCQSIFRVDPDKVPQVVGSDLGQIRKFVQMPEGDLVLACDGATVLGTVGGCTELRLPPGCWVDHEVAADSIHEAEAALKDAADKLLANTVIENYRVELL